MVTHVLPLMFKKCNNVECCSKLVIITTVRNIVGNVKSFNFFFKFDSNGNSE